MGSESVRLYGFWASPYALRVHVGLKAKGIEYEYVEEKLTNKSASLLEYNPVRKKVPVLLHNANPISESLIILEYIDETWTHNPLLPTHPYDRARARFWAKFIDDKCIPAMVKTLTKEGREKESAAEEVRESLKVLEGGLGKKQPFFGGEAFGFVDIAAGWLGLWAGLIEKVSDVVLIVPENTPLLCAWFDRCLEVPIYKESLPPRDELLSYIRKLPQTLSARSS